jgi:tyrocidine synthetase-3
LAGYIKEAEEKRYMDIKAVEMKDYYPLSSAQKRLHFLQQLDLENTAYNMADVLKLDGGVDKDKLEETFREMTRRHESYRTSFIIVDEEPVQRIHREVEFKVEYFDLTAGAKGEGGGDHDSSSIIHGFVRAFDLTKAPLLRAGLVKLPENKHLVMVDLHHIISDGVSNRLFVREFVRLYFGEVLPGLRVQYKDYAVWQTGELLRWMRESREKYWLREFPGEVPVLHFPYDYPRPAVQGFEGSSFVFEIGKEETAALNRLALEHGVTLFMVLIAGFNILLSRFSGQQDIVIGTPTAGRGHTDLENIMGMFVNTLALRNFPGADKTFKEFLSEVKTRTLGAFENQDYQFENLVENVAVRRDIGRSPLFDIMFAFQNLEERVEMAPAGREGFVSEYRFEKWVSRFDMTWSVIEKVSWLSIEVEYCTRLFKRETIERAAVCFKNVLAGAAASPGTRTADIEIISAEEKQRILVEFNDTGREYPMDKTIHGLFVEQAEKRPEKMALVGSWRLAVGKGEGIGETGQLTYGELNKRSDQVAGLLRERGVHNDIIVGIMLERSLEMIIGILGILKAGGAYLPIAPEYPRQRIDYMLKDSNAMILLSEVSEVSEVSGVSEVSEKFPAQLCYVIYTSGSTGKPKGVMVEHRSVINRLNWMQRAYPIGEADRILQKTPTVFDVSVWELFWWSFQGASLSLPGHGDEKSPEAIVEAIRRQGVTTMHFVPSMLAVFLDYVEEYGDTGALRSLRQVFASGEALGSHQVKRFNRLLYTANNTRLINLYGPTEATVDVSFFNCDLNGDRIPERIPIGKPIDNIQLIVLDRYLQLLPIGIPGELCIGGDGVARGYVNRPELTAEKFVDYRSYRSYRTYIPRKVYKTGDLVRWLPDGNLEFLGRMDRQVKIRGYRIELGEIENRLSMHPGIKEALVMTKETDGGDKFLCAYIVPGEEDVLTGELKEYLSRALPAYMVPSYFVLLKAMPLTPNGKVDRNALPEPTAGYRSKYAAPADELEETLAEICTGLLGVNIGSDDNIFELGGHSLKIMTLISRIHKELDVKIPLFEVFQHQTTAKLAQYIRNTSMPMDRYSPIPKAGEREYYALSAAQKRLFIIQQMELESTQYNMLFMFPIGNKDEGIKKERLEKISRKLISRHESLRTSFHLFDDEPVQQIHDEVKFEIEYYDLAAKNAKDRERIIKNFIRPFDLSKAPLLRVGLIETGDSDYLLVIDMHHIISDGISQGILEREFNALYAGEELPPLGFQYKDYSEWQNSRRQQKMMKIQEKYWLKRFPGGLPILNLPADYPRLPVRGYEGRQLGFFIGKEITGSLKGLCRETGATLYMVLLTAFNVLLSRLSGQEDIIVGTPAAGRRHADLQDIIGMFVNTLSMRNFPAEEKRFSDFLREVKERTLEVYENQEYQFEDLVDKVSVKRDTGRNPIFDVMLAFLDRSESRVDIRGTDFDTDTVSDRGESKANFDITFEGTEVDDVVYFTVDYNTAIYRLETIKRFIIYFKRILAEIKDDPGRRLVSINLISEAEKKQISVDFNDTAVEYAGEKMIHELFAQQAERVPDSVAAVGKAEGIGETGQLTYGELNKRSDQLAGLLRERGVHNDIIVGIMVERSVEMIIGILGILKSGGAYLPIAPDYPQERIDYMLKDSGAKILLTELPEGHKLHHSSFIIHHCNSLAYVIYTSGSTGRPKGVMVEHGNLSAYVGAFSREFAITADDTVMQQASFTFDAFVEEVYPTLLKGGRIAVAAGDELLDINLLSKFIAGNRISVISFSPLLLSHLNQCSDLDRVCRYIHTVISGGDVLKQEYIGELLKVGRVYNTYGPTETTVCATYYEYSSGVGSSIPIGKPIANYNVYILDKYNNLLPIGVAGELCVAGAGVTRGYLNQPELTAVKFDHDLWDYRDYRDENQKLLQGVQGGGFLEKGPPGRRRLYKTGDLARWLADGNLEFLGRMDQQVKIRGYRIELGEIENQLLKIKGIKEAVVLVKKDNTLQNSLCAYIVPEPGTKMESREIKNTLARVFPAYMIPDYLMPVEQIPLTPNGKIDRRALSAPGVQRADAITAPGNDLEEKVIEIWAEILGIEKGAIGMTDNFFELGGHSLKLTKLIIRIHKVFNVGIPVGELFKKPTVEGVCSLISVAEWAREQDREPDAGPKNEEVVL